MKEKTKELADSVGAVYPTLFLGRHDGVLFTETELETFVELVAAAEREACAKLCEEHTMPSELANAIRNGAMRDAKLNAGWGSEQQAEPPPEWPLVKNILAEYGLDAIAFVAEWKAAQRPWVGLTEEEVKHLYPYGRSVWGKETFEAIEKALKEKNSAN